MSEQTGAGRGAFPRGAGGGGEGLERDGSSLFCRQSRPGHPRPGGAGLRRRNEQLQPLKKLPLLLLGVVIAQAAFGMWTVTLGYGHQVVTAHLP